MKVIVSVRETEDYWVYNGGLEDMAIKGHTKFSVLYRGEVFNLQRPVTDDAWERKAFNGAGEMLQDKLIKNNGH